MADSPSTLSMVRRVVKVLSIALGGLCTFVFFASLVGIATDNGWARGIVALVLTVALPAVAVDRALPKKDAGKARPGLVSDVVALVLLGIALAFVGIGQPLTRPLLVHEGDRVAESGYEVAAHAVYFLAGVRPVDALTVPAAPVAPSVSAAPAASPSASGVPSASASGGW
jgi:hypothetical protein